MTNRIFLRNAAIVTGLSFLLLEILLRFIGIANPVLYVADDACGYRHRPNQRVRLWANTISINQLGLRDSREFGVSRRRTRILVLGDSVTWGGVTLRDNELFTQRLERLLPQSEVINAGVNGYSTSQMVSFYTAHLKSLRPDVIVVYCIPGDFTRPPIVNLDSSNIAYPSRPPILAIGRALALARYHLAARTGWAWLKPPRPGQDAAATDENILRNVDALIQLRSQLDAYQRLDVFLSPELPGRPGTELRDRIRAMLTVAGLNALELDASQPVSEEWFIDGTHLSATGHDHVADWIARILAPNSTE